MTEKNDQKDIQIQENLARIKHRIMVLSGKGGVGKSFIAVNLAYGLAMQGKKVGLLDVDIHGPSVAKLTKIEGVRIPVHAEKKMPTPIQVLSNLSVLSVASLLNNDSDALIWRGPLKMALIKQFFSDFYWEELDYLVVDCPPGTGDEPLSIAQVLKEIDGTVIVTTPQDVAVLDVKKSVNFVKQMNLPILGIIENMKYFRCPKCGEITSIFKGNQLEKLLQEQNIERLAELDMEPEIAQSTDEGKPYIYFYNKFPSAQKLMDATLKIIESIEK